MAFHIWKVDETVDYCQVCFLLCTLFDHTQGKSCSANGLQSKHLSIDRSINYVNIFKWIVKEKGEKIDLKAAFFWPNNCDNSTQNTQTHHSQVFEFIALQLRLNFLKRHKQQRAFRFGKNMDIFSSFVWLEYTYVD